MTEIELGGSGLCTPDEKGKHSLLDRFVGEFGEDLQKKVALFQMCLFCIRFPLPPLCRSKIL